MGSVGLDWRYLCELMGLIQTDRQVDKQTHGKGGKNGVRQRRGEGRRKCRSAYKCVYRHTSIYNYFPIMSSGRAYKRNTDIREPMSTSSTWILIPKIHSPPKG